MATSVNFDNTSIEILKKVDAIHRDSLINVALALVSKTGYYKTLAGEVGETLEDVASLDTIDELEQTATSNKVAKAPSKSASDWSDF